VLLCDTVIRKLHKPSNMISIIMFDGLWSFLMTVSHNRTKTVFSSKFQENMSVAWSGTLKLVQTALNRKIMLLSMWPRDIKTFLTTTTKKNKITCDSDSMHLMTSTPDLMHSLCSSRKRFISSLF
jgi:hypothetical protein